MLDMAADDAMLVRLPRALCAAWKVAPLCAVLRKVPVQTYRTLYISRCLQRGSNNPQQVLHLPTSLPWPRAWCCSLGVHSSSAAACNETFHSRHERFVDLPSFEQRHASSLEPPRAVGNRTALCAPSPCRPNRSSCSTSHQWQVCIRPICLGIGVEARPSPDGHV